MPRTTNGFFAGYSAEAADRLLGSQNTYFRQNAFFRLYKRIWGPFIFRMNLESGVVFSRRPEGVPIYERYFLGGIQTIRGYRLFSLGPRINVQSDLDPSSFLQQFTVGANWQLILNTEVEFLILPAVQIKGVIFFDAGNGYNLEQKYCTSSTANGPGSSTLSMTSSASTSCRRIPTR